MDVLEGRVVSLLRCVTSQNAMRFGARFAVRAMCLSERHAQSRVDSVVVARDWFGRASLVCTARQDAMRIAVIFVGVDSRV